MLTKPKDVIKEILKEKISIIYILIVFGKNYDLLNELVCELVYWTDANEIINNIKFKNITYYRLSITKFNKYVFRK